MLDNTTKKKINTLRDILVGKVSDPKSQVEQITIAMFYKFMWDMDNELVNELGAKPKFFIDDFKKYSWEQLFAPSLGGEDMLNLYKEAVEKMENNPNIPSAFRDIFKRAYLPYNDPSTLRMFLKVINDGFHYSHSEMLGDAFEYLLSILGTQGDAGQFRTPRHIIDFITECVNPQKGDIICDPSCGTAGFVISAYKHILKQNTDKKSGDKLSPNDKKKLGDNLIGLDIDPMMVKLALANMYLHGFNDPHIAEYDSLTNEDRWNDTYDVVLANPPFMTPKGGIRPHKRFTTKANRAEVLFVDLIATHLSANGRAGIIVPNGIVATTQNAYKSLRKLIIKDSLIAVISLPAGVFQPYSGVKTSILILDKAVSKKTDSILFLKVENDGFDLGSNRSPIDKNDLPNILTALERFKDSIKNGTDIDVESQEVDCLVVGKKEILENRDVILSGDRYRKQDDYLTDYPLLKVIDTFKTNNQNVNKIKKSDFKEKGKYPIIDQSSKYIAGYWDNADDVYQVSSPVVVFGDHTRCFKLVDFDFVKGADGIQILSPIDDFLPSFYYYALRSIKLKSLGYSRHFKLLKEKVIPLPPLEVQEQIVAEIEGYQKIIDGARMVVDNYKPTISIKTHWEMVELGSVCTIKRGKFSHRPRNEPRFFGGKYPFIQTGDVVKAKGGSVGYKQTLNEEGLSVSKLFHPPLVLLTIAANIGDTAILDYDACFTDSVVGITPIDTNKIDTYFLQVLLSQKQEELNEVAAATQSAQKNLSVSKLSPITIHIPSISEQKIIMKGILLEQEIVNSNKKLIALYEQKIQKRIAQVWGEDE